MKKLLGLLVLLIFSACSTFGQKEELKIDSFLKFIDILEKSESKQRKEIVGKNYDVLLKKTELPIINGNEVTFVYVGQGKDIKLEGDMTGWGAKSIKMKAIEATNIHYATRTFETNARIDYKIVVDGNWIVDPLNKKVSKSGFGFNSEFIMPEYPEQPEIKYYKDIPHGEIIRDQFIVCKAVKSGQVEESKRRYHVYLPPNYSQEKHYTTIYFQDGMDYIFNMQINNVLDYMIYHKEIEPVIGVFIDYIDRNEDYINNQKSVYADFLIKEFIPFIDSKYSTIKNRDNRVLVGLSNSGSSAIYISHRFNDIFSKVLSHSGALSTLYSDGSNFGKSFNESLGEKIESEYFPVKIYLNAGTYEPSIKNVNIKFYEQLKNNKSLVDAKFDIENQGHALPFWRDTTREGLMWLFD